MIGTSRFGLKQVSPTTDVAHTSMIPPFFELFGVSWRFLTHLITLSEGTSGKDHKTIFTRNLQPYVTSSENLRWIENVRPQGHLIPVRGRRFNFWKLNWCCHFGSNGSMYVFNFKFLYSFCHIFFISYFFLFLFLFFHFHDRQRWANIDLLVSFHTYQKFIKWLYTNKFTTLWARNSHLACMVLENITMSKAFDTINHSLLLAKLLPYSFYANSFKLLQTYLSNRS